MAQLTGNLEFTGSLGNISAYRRKGSDKIIVRTKGGAKKARIKKDANFASTRRINSEFGGRATASKFLMQAIGPLRPLADYNIAGPLNALTRPIQAMDTVSAWGERNINFTALPHLLEGFNVNNRTPFYSIIQNPLSYELAKTAGTGLVRFPALIPGVNFFVPEQYAFYQLLVSVGFVSNVVYTPYGYRALYDFSSHAQLTDSAWHSVKTGSPAENLEAKWTQPIDAAILQETIMILSVGIRFGRPEYGSINPFQSVGGGILLGVV